MQVPGWRCELHAVVFGERALGFVIHRHACESAFSTAQSLPGLHRALYQGNSAHEDATAKAVAKYLAYRPLGPVVAVALDRAMAANCSGTTAGKD